MLAVSYGLTFMVSTVICERKCGITQKSLEIGSP